jgi:hypothetical protein
MAEQGTGTGATGTTDPKCKTPKELLTEINEELLKFEAKKLGELKAELEAFVKKQDGIVSEYEKKYPALRARWCEQQQRVESLYAQIKAAFPGQDWKQIVRECICTPKHDLECEQKRIDARARCCSGSRERRRDRAKKAFDAAKTHLDTVANNAAKVEAELNEDEKLISKDIREALAGPERAVAMYLFWFKLLPVHRRLRPADMTDACAKFDAEDPLCPDEDCKDEPGGCKPSGAEEADPVADAHCPGDEDTAVVPALLLPKAYAEELERAWRNYRNAKDLYATAESAYKAAPDDLASLRKKLEDDTKTLEDRIKECLKGKKPEDKCCTETHDPDCGCGHKNDGKGVTRA